MAELIISLSGWLLILGILVPILIQVNKQSIEIQEKSEALHILYRLYANRNYRESCKRK